MGALAKAKISVVDGQGSKIDGKGVTAYFNPKEFSVTKAVTWNQHKKPGHDKPFVQFTTGQPAKLAVELFFDGYEKRKSVKPECRLLLRMAQMDPELHYPPQVQFEWANNDTFKGVMDNVSAKYTMFLEDGTPVRAAVTIGMQSATPTDKTDKSNETLSPDYAKLHTMRRGETLHAIADREYDDASEWRRIADANGIDDPLSIEPGTKLLIPPIL